MTLERKFRSLSIWIFNSWHKAIRVFFWSCVSRRGTNLAATRLMFKSTVKIRWQELPTHTCSFLRSRQLCTDDPHWNFFLEFFRHSRRYDVLTGRPELGWSSTLVSPLLNRAYHSKTCVRLSASSLKAFWSISCASVAVFPRRKQNIKQIRCSVRSDITISRENLTTLGRIDNTNPYNLLRRRPPGYWLVKGATTLT